MSGNVPNYLINDSTLGTVKAQQGVQLPAGFAALQKDPVVSALTAILVGKLADDNSSYTYTWNGDLLASIVRQTGGSTKTMTMTYDSSGRLLSASAWE